MEDQNSWKGHTFTLMIFGGIVVLCAIFFVLGMLVGRMQALKLATVTVEAASKPESKEPLPARVERPEPKLPEPAAKPETPAPRPALPKVESAPLPGSGVSLQVGAWKKKSEAEKQLAELKKKGFGRAFILSPAAADPGPLYRVQVAVADLVEADVVKQKLDAAGFKAIIKK